MCGGEGSRLEATVEKPLFEIGGRPMIDRVLNALATDTLETVYAAVSPNAPETRSHLERMVAETSDSSAHRCERPVIPDSPDTPGSPDLPDSLEIVDTPGSGYVTDLQSVLERPGVSTPLLTVTADLPLLESPVIERIVDRYRAVAAGNTVKNDSSGGPSVTVCVPTSVKRRLGFSVETVAHDQPHLAATGANVVGSEHRTMTHTSYDPRLASNVNRRTDARATERLRSALGVDGCE
ncbi:NTP transferase domain-containing protein [Halobacteria archaeon AArc-curdl1]|uniref:NTP transferase domain-containing protein n=1 Tax=Natronosalvus hydrolyticus TaxID=2979988 RepID=A0AAP3E606_9EURY|nr:NTP transferase domain-containing protein [Halobacteria archaeon AArc-curdl1]